MKITKRIRKINETVAAQMTRAFGTMWMCYAFMIYGLLPLVSILQPHQDNFLYWSNWVQLWSLPLIMVGTNILGRDADRRARIDHDRLAKTYKEQLETNDQMMQAIKMIEHLIQDEKNADADLDTIMAQLSRLERKYDLLMPAANRVFQDRYCDCSQADE